MLVLDLRRHVQRILAKMLAWWENKELMSNLVDENIPARLFQQKADMPHGAKNGR